MKKTLDALLAEHPFPKSLPARYLEVLAGCARNVRFEEGSFLLREGQGADHFFLIRRGRVSIEIYAPGRGAIPVQTVEVGEVLGWSWIVPPYRSRFDARAATTVSAISLDGRCLRGKCARDHELGYELLRRFAAVASRRLEATRFQLLDLYGTDS